MKMQLSTYWHWGYNAWTSVLEATPLQRLWSSHPQIRDACTLLKPNRVKVNQWVAGRSLFLYLSW